MIQSKQEMHLVDAGLSGSRNTCRLHGVPVPIVCDDQCHSHKSNEDRQSDAKNMERHAGGASNGKHWSVSPGKRTHKILISS